MQHLEGALQRTPIGHSAGVHARVSAHADEQNVQSVLFAEQFYTRRITFLLQESSQTRARRCLQKWCQKDILFVSMVLLESDCFPAVKASTGI